MTVSVPVFEWFDALDLIVTGCVCLRVFLKYKVFIVKSKSSASIASVIHVFL